MDKETNAAAGPIVPEDVKEAAQRIKANRGKHPEADADRRIVAKWFREYIATEPPFTATHIGRAIGIEYSTIYSWSGAKGIDVGVDHSRVGGLDAAKERFEERNKTRIKQRAAAHAEPVFTKSFVVPASTDTPPSETAPLAKPGKFILFVGDNDTLETAIKGLREIFSK